MVLALASFIVAVGASVYVLLPSTRLSFGYGGRATYEMFYRDRDDLGEVYRGLVQELDFLWIENARVIRSVVRLYRVGAAALTVEVLVLAALTTGRVF